MDLANQMDSNDNSNVVDNVDSIGDDIDNLLNVNSNILNNEF
jgi:hypothetical protein